MIHLSQCCCGCTLQTGSKIIGYWEAAISCITLITASAIAANLGSIDSQMSKDDETLLRTILILMAVLAAVQFLFALLLIIGATTLRAAYLFPWIIFTGVGIFIATVLALTQIIGFFNVGVLINWLISTGLQIYFLLVVNSLYVDIKTGTIVI